MSAKEFIGLYLKARDWLGGMAYDAKALTRLAAIVGHEPEFILRNAASGAVPAPVANTVLPSVPHARIGAYSARGRRVAPGIMRSDGDKPYTRLAWSVEAFPCDLVTGERLISRCTACGKEPTWHTDQISHCNYCHFDLRDIEPTYWPAEELAGIRVIASLMGWQGGKDERPLDLPEPFGSLPALDLVAALGWCAYLQGVLDGSGIDAIAAHSHLGLPVAQAWPAPLEHLANLMTRQINSKAFDLQIAMELLMGNSLPAGVAERVRSQASEALQRAVHSRGSDTDYNYRSYLTLPDLSLARRQG